jgi:hypothetical protein
MKIASVLMMVFTIILGSNSAQAALIESELFVTGDGLITFDSDTGLEWLDLTETVGVSLADVIAGYDGFTTTNRFSLATKSQVLGLAGNAGIATIGSWNTDASHKSNVLGLINLLGVTYNSGRTMANGQYALDDHSGLAEVSFDHIASWAAIVNFQTSVGWPPKGTFLVRSATPAAGEMAVAENVPEPSIIALFGLGLVGIGFARRRQS